MDENEKPGNERPQATTACDSSVGATPCVARQDSDSSSSELGASSPGAPASCRLLKKTEILLRAKVGLAILIAIPVCLSLYFFKSYPFPDELASRTFALSILSPTQRNNIDIAARAVNNTVLEPGEEFSFNRVVGPRTDGKGYRPAPSYLGPDSPATVGGGICLVSSAIYQAALESNCKIVERVPHLRTIASVPPGLDATVWYGRADLKFRNNFTVPIQISAECKDNNLRVKFLGQKNLVELTKSKLHTVVVSQNREELLVEAFAETDGKRHLLSRDLYRK